MTKKIVNVWYNHGRWITRCPKCRAKTQVKPVGKSEKQQIKWHCGNCHSGKIKRILKVNPKGEIAYAYSRKDQMKAAEDAYNSNGIHTAIFPEDWLEAERLLRKRRLEFQHYRPHEIHPKLGRKEVAADLVIENETQPVILEPVVARKAFIDIKRKSLPVGLYKELQ